MAFKSISLAAIALVASTSADAAIITHNFTLTADTGIYAGTSGVGTFTYDTANIFFDGWSSGGYSIRREEGLTIEFTVLGQTYTEDDDRGVGVQDIAVPLILFNSNYDVLGIDFAVSEIAIEENGLFTTVVDIDEVGVSGFTFISDLALQQDGSYTGRMDVELSAVPVPAAVWLFGSGLLGLAGVARRKKA